MVSDEAAGYQENVSIAIKQLAYSAAALLGLVIGISKGLFIAVIEKIEERRNILIWGIMALIILALPKLFGFSIWMTGDKKPPAE